MVVNDNAFILDEPGALETIASKLAPTIDLICRGFCDRHITPVGASLLAMDVNDNAFILDELGALETIASKLAPTILSLIHI